MRPRTDSSLAAREPFAEGTARYLDSYPGRDETQPRIYVKFRPTGTESSFFALLDTGAHFCTLNEVAASLIRDHLGETLGSFSAEIAHGRVEGDLYRHTITLVAEIGESLQIDAVVFVPLNWHGPCFLGYAGVLERIRFAVDPRNNHFHFGAL